MYPLAGAGGNGAHWLGIPRDELFGRNWIADTKYIGQQIVILPKFRQNFAETKWQRFISPELPQDSWAKNQTRQLQPNIYGQLFQTTFLRDKQTDLYCRLPLRFPPKRNISPNENFTKTIRKWRNTDLFPETKWHKDLFRRYVLKIFRLYEIKNILWYEMKGNICMGERNFAEISTKLFSSRNE